MATEKLTHLDAFKEAVGADEQVPSEVEAAPEEEPVEEVETVVEDVEAGEKAEETKEPAVERDPELASTLAALTHEEVANSKAGKGMLSEIKQLREENRALKAAKPATEEAAPAEDEEDDDELDDDTDVFTRADVKRIVARELKVHLSKGAKATTPEVTQSLQAGLDLLVKAQADGEIPPGLKTDTIVKTAITELQKSNPALLRGLMAEPNAVQAIWDHAARHVPAVRTAIAAAAKAQDDVKSERLAKGQSPGGEAPISVDTLVNVLNTRHKQKWE